ncbi:MAG: tRNA (adenosine(37)-N6)-dimethylallyltransferase MiaA [Desulfobacterales bacterium]|nr:tRNA (adenosine(37)-N6)-dimethylallyltransferase MiaA [Desulfobacterales bacterium]MDJ0884818.1 tRNA (adenosine(37)-N6)-dimethylallyltransferase MiaA [Desulfobacterales bacterium]
MSTGSQKVRIIIICGPTGIGKTTVGIRLAQRLGGQIVGADAMQIYRRMDIGTAKPTPAEQAAVRHHMIDVVDPDAPFDAARYAQMASDCIRRLDREAILPVVAGGTGFYIKALLFGLFDARPPDPQIRRRLEKQAEKEGLAGLYAVLQRSDPASAERIHAHDRFRIIRALETLESTGRPISDLQRRHGFSQKRYETFKIGLEIDRSRLYARINQRVEGMLAEGLLNEVQTLLDQGYAADLKSMQSIGYRHMVDYLAGRTPWEASVELMKRDTRRYAKRQFTWFKSDPEIIWSAPEDVDRLVPAIEAFLKTGASNPA